MVGLVIVSHSRELAAGVAALAAGVSETSIPIAHAGGVGDNHEELGTDATQIMEAIESVFSPDGVLILMDLGSAILSAETALEFLGEDYAELVRVCAAPLVEGAVAAAVQIGIGADIDTVTAEAMDALMPKQQQLGGAVPADRRPPEDTDEVAVDSDVPAEGGHTFQILTQHGLHARPAAKFVETCSKFKANIMVRNLSKESEFVNAASLNRIALLSVTYGDTIEVLAKGPESEQAIKGISGLVAENFGEAAAPPETRKSSAAAKRTKATAAVAETPTDHPSSPSTPTGISEGWAVGPLLRVETSEPELPDHAAADAEYELELFNTARDRVRSRMEKQAHSLGARGAAGEAEILKAHQLILDDPEVLQAVVQSVSESGNNAARAYADTMQELAQAYSASPDPYLAQRAVDIHDVRRALLRELLEEGTGDAAGPDSPVILYARELTPSDTAQLDPERILGIMTELGGPTSHAAILARALGIPAVAGIAADAAATAKNAAIDGRAGTVILDPDAGTEQEFNAKRETWLTRRRELRQRSGEAAYTIDKRLITVQANIGDLAGANHVNPNGAEGVGLLRTEFMFLSRRNAPTEDEQTQMLTKMFNAVGDQPVTVRTLDIGGDKELAYIQLPEEENPFLGLRGIRLCLTEKALFKEHLRAILRASVGHRVSLMLPMVSRIEEIEAARAVLEDAAAELRGEGIEIGELPPLGIMIETPAAVLQASRMAEHAAFFSIGTNDLTQYIMAAERGAKHLVDIADPMHPAVLTAIAQSVAAAERAGIELSVCGEAASAPETAVLLIGLGVQKLSMNPSAVPGLKDLVRHTRYDAVKALAERAMSCGDASGVRRLVEDYLEAEG
ncbi:MAG: phosphoenolpyruvate--protein phosphotransferase [Spirochaetaceae bacterium]|nr:MAG: phosphoenolpyruvate--protein phosphotransferase [Spirochaetaceae bacterium]